MDYKQHDIQSTVASEAELVYESVMKQTSRSEIEKECLSLEESKRLILEMVHRHFHPES